MSDLQEIIVSSSIKAFNSGYRQGKEDAVKVLREAIEKFERPASLNYRAELLKLIEEIQP